MRHLTIKLIDEAIFNEFEVLTSIDDLRYLDGTFVLTPELTFQTVVTLKSSGFNTDTVAVSVEVKTSLGISFADFAKLIINKSLTTPFNKSVYDTKLTILSLTDEKQYVSEDTILEQLSSGDHVFRLTVN
jgi:hypothetical protein